MLLIYLFVCTGAILHPLPSSAEVPLVDIFGQPWLPEGEAYQIRHAADWEQLLQNVAMITNMPSTMDHMPINPKAKSILNRVGDMSKLRPREFNPRLPTLLELSPEDRVECLEMGVELDDTLNDKVHLVNSTSRTQKSLPAPSLWEYARILDGIPLVLRFYPALWLLNDPPIILQLKCVLVKLDEAFSLLSYWKNLIQDC